jgi:hypothetical protein
LGRFGKEITFPLSISGQPRTENFPQLFRRRALAHIDDFTLTPVNGQRVQFYMVRDSAGDKIAVSIAPL